MAQTIPVPEAAFTSIDIPINSQDYTFTYRLNDRDDRWRIDIYRDDVNIIYGLKVVEQQSLTQAYPWLEAELDGSLICTRINLTTEKATIGNTGIDKDYEIIYVSFEEQAELSG